MFVFFWGGDWENILFMWKKRKVMHMRFKIKWKTRESNMDDAKMEVYRKTFNLNDWKGKKHINEAWEINDMYQKWWNKSAIKLK